MPIPILHSHFIPMPCPWVYNNKIIGFCGLLWESFRRYFVLSHAIGPNQRFFFFSEWSLLNSWDSIRRLGLATHMKEDSIDKWWRQWHHVSSQKATEDFPPVNRIEKMESKRAADNSGEGNKQVGCKEPKDDIFLTSVI